MFSPGQGKRTLGAGVGETSSVFGVIDSPSDQGLRAKRKRRSCTNN
jgi:hypothetical protein